MRYIPVGGLEEGMVLARPFYGSNFDVLLAEGTALGANQISRIDELGYAGAYISDELSRDIVVRDVIDGELRRKLLQSAREVLTKAENWSRTKSRAMLDRAQQYKMIMPVIEAIIASGHRVLDMLDLKPHDDYPYYHAANVTVLSLLTGVELGLSGTQLFDLGLAALLHDVGNIFIPDSILNKPGPLTEEEYALVQRHTDRGFELLKDNFDLSIDACIGALQHHENFDGSGYPNRLKKHRISVLCRVIAIAEVYDALISRRPYRRPMPPASAMEFLEANAGGMFDPELVAAFQRVVARYPAGFCVELSTGVRCLVAQNYRDYPLRPRLKLIHTMSSSPMYVDLLGDPSFAGVYIARIIET